MDNSELDPGQIPGGDRPTFHDVRENEVDGRLRPQGPRSQLHYTGNFIRTRVSPPALSSLKQRPVGGVGVRVLDTVCLLVQLNV